MTWLAPALRICAELRETISVSHERAATTSQLIEQSLLRVLDEGVKKWAFHCPRRLLPLQCYALECAIRRIGLRNVNNKKQKGTEGTLSRNVNKKLSILLSDIVSTIVADYPSDAMDSDDTTREVWNAVWELFVNPKGGNVRNLVMHGFLCHVNVSLVNPEVMRMDDLRVLCEALQSLIRRLHDVEGSTTSSLLLPMVGLDGELFRQAAVEEWQLMMAMCLDGELTECLTNSNSPISSLSLSELSSDVLVLWGLFENRLRCWFTADRMHLLHDPDDAQSHPVLMSDDQLREWDLLFYPQGDCQFEDMASLLADKEFEMLSEGGKRLPLHIRRGFGGQPALFTFWCNVLVEPFGPSLRDCQVHGKVLLFPHGPLDETAVPPSQVAAMWGLEQVLRWSVQWMELQWRRQFLTPPRVCGESDDELGLKLAPKIKRFVDRCNAGRCFTCSSVVRRRGLALVAYVQGAAAHHEFLDRWRLKRLEGFCAKEEECAREDSLTIAQPEVCVQASDDSAKWLEACRMHIEGNQQQKRSQGANGCIHAGTLMTALRERKHQQRAIDEPQLDSADISGSVGEVKVHHLLCAAVLRIFAIVEVFWGSHLQRATNLEELVASRKARTTQRNQHAMMVEAFHPLLQLALDCLLHKLTLEALEAFAGATEGKTALRRFERAERTIGGCLAPAQPVEWHTVITTLCGLL